MSDNIHDKRPVAWLSIPLSEETWDRLLHLADVCRAEPDEVAASLLHDILKDDAEAHFLLTTAPASTTLN